MNCELGLAFAELYQAVPQARAIFDKYKSIYTDEYSKWLGRWVIRAEKHMAEKSHCAENIKQEITDKLIRKLITQILVSPYDLSSFNTDTEKKPVLFKGLIFPNWMLEDIFTLLGIPNGMDQAKPHEFMLEILEWTKSLKQRSVAVLSESRELVSVKTGGELMVVKEGTQPTQLNSTLLVSINFVEQPELAIIKLLTYRNLIINAFKVMENRIKNKEIRRQTRQIVRFGEEQRGIIETEKAQLAQGLVAHKQAVKKQFGEISQIQESTQDIMKKHYQSLIDEMNYAEVRMKKLKQDCKDKEANIQSFIVAQNSLH